MPAIPLKGQHHENWQALLASVAEKTPDVRAWSGGAAIRSFPVRRLRKLLLFSILMIIAYGTLSALYLSARWADRGRTWGYCWDPALWAWYDSQLKSSRAHEKPRPTDRPGLWL
jgi:hypothetical protein